MPIVTETELLGRLDEFEPRPTDYFRHGAARIAASLSMIPEGRGRVLELGCDSHFTLALSLFTKFVPTPQNSPTPIGAPENVERPEVRFDGAHGESRVFERILFDAEKAAFPFADETFEGVLCCELIEHLFFDPAWLLHEANRVLKPGGWLLLTTPNLTSYHSIRRAALGIHPLEHSLYFNADKYSALPIQHTREYAFWEIVTLLQECGFASLVQTTKTFTRNERLGFWECLVLVPACWIYALAKVRHPKHLLPAYRRPHTFVLARKSGSPTSRWPAGLYLP